MRKILIGATAAAAFMLSFGAGPASAAPNWSQYCTSIGDGGLSHGDCTSILNGYYNKGQGNNDAAALCKDIKDFSPAFFDANYGNIGHCIKALAPLLPG